MKIQYESQKEMVEITNKGNDLVSFILHEVPNELERVLIRCGADWVTLIELQPNVNLLPTVLVGSDSLPFSAAHYCSVYVEFVFSEQYTMEKRHVKIPIYSDEEYWIEKDFIDYGPIIIGYRDELRYVQVKNEYDTPPFEVVWRPCDQKITSHVIKVREHFHITREYKEEDQDYKEKLKKKYNIQEYEDEGRMTLDQDFVVSGVFGRKVLIDDLPPWEKRILKIKN